MMVLVQTRHQLKTDGNAMWDYDDVIIGWRLRILEQIGKNRAKRAAFSQCVCQLCSCGKHRAEESR